MALMQLNVRQLTAVALSLLVIAFAVSEYAIFQFTQERIRGDLVKTASVDALARAKESSSLLELEVQSMQSRLNILATAPLIVEGSPEECTVKVKELLPLFAPKVGSLNRMNAEGVFDCSTIDAVVGADGSTEPYLKTLLEDESHPAVMTVPVLSQFSGRWASALQVPLFDSNKEFKGSIGGALYVDELQKRYLEDVELYEGQSTLLLSEDGNILYSENPDIIGLNLLTDENLLADVTLSGSEKMEEVLADVFTGGSGVAGYRDANGQEFLAAYHAVEVLPEGRSWVLIIVTPVDAALASLGLTSGPLNPFLYLYYATVGLAVLAAAILLVFFDRRLFAPLKELTRTIEKLSRGESDVKVPESLAKSGDEIGLLAKAFDRTLVSLKLAMRLTAPELKKELAKEKVHSQEVTRSLLKRLEDVNQALNQSSIVSITDKQGDITYVNDKFVEISKYSKEELLGQNHRLLKSKLGKEDFHTPEFYQSLWSDIAGGRVWKGDIRNKAKDGSIYWVRSVLMPTFDDSFHHKVAGYVAVRTPITDKMQDIETAIRAVEARRKASPEMADLIKGLRNGTRKADF